MGDVSEQYGYSLVVCDLLVLCAIGLILLSTLEPSFRLPRPSARIRSQVSELALPSRRIEHCHCLLRRVSLLLLLGIHALRRQRGSLGCQQGWRLWGDPSPWPTLGAARQQVARRAQPLDRRHVLFRLVCGLVTLGPCVPAPELRGTESSRGRSKEEPVEQIVFSQFANNLSVLYPVCSAR